MMWESICVYSKDEFVIDELGNRIEGYIKEPLIIRARVTEMSEEEIKVFDINTIGGMRKFVTIDKVINYDDLIVINNIKYKIVSIKDLKKYLLVVIRENERWQT